MKLVFAAHLSIVLGLAMAWAIVFSPAFGKPLPRSIDANMQFAQAEPEKARMDGASSREPIAFGVNGHPFSAYRVPIEAQIERIADLGLTRYRVDIRSEEDFPALERLIEAASRRQILITPVLTPQVDLRTAKAEVVYKQAYALAFSAAKRFRSIPVWELGNEAENFAIIQPCEKRDDGSVYNCAWGPAGGLYPLDYFGPRWSKVSSMLKGLSDGVISANPLARKAIGAAGWGHIGVFRRLRDDGVKWDISVWHFYGEDPEWALQQLAAYGKPVWITEFNNGNEPGDTVDAGRGIAKWMTRLKALSAMYPLEAAFIYELLDEPYWTDNEGKMGLVSVFPDKSGALTATAPKPAFDMVRATAAPMPPPAPPACLAREQAAQVVSVDGYAACLMFDISTAASSSGAVMRPSSAPAAGQNQIAMAFRRTIAEPAWRKLCPPESCGDMGFVRLLYRKLLAREPDPAGQDAYVRALLSGAMKRADVVTGIVELREFALAHPKLFTAH